MNNFCQSLRFAWPFDPRDTYLRNTITDMYSYSSDFIRRQGDLRCYRVRREFIDLFPELQCDMPSFDPSPWNQDLWLTMEMPDWRAQRQTTNRAAELLIDEDLATTPSNWCQHTLRQVNLSDPGLSIFGLEPMAL